MSGVFTNTRNSSVRSDVTRTGNLVPGVYNRVVPALDTVTSFRSGGASDHNLSNQEILDSAKELVRTGFRTKYDNGHPFSSTQYRYGCSFGPVDLPWSFGGIYSGRMKGTPLITGLDAVSLWPTVPSINTSYYGPKAIAATRPTKPAASLAQFTGELFQGLPRMIGSTFLHDKSAIFRNAGSEYLNVQFGWVPFISDLNKLLRAVLQSSKIVDQYVRDSGRNVRRQFYFPTTTKNTTLYDRRERACPLDFGGDGQPFYALMRENYGSSSPSSFNLRSFAVNDFVSERYWFSGAYTYYLEDETSGDKMKRFEQLANRLLGSRITPETLWELAPWSWLVDWWATIGTLTGNAVAFQNDKLVLKYGYLMRTYKVQRLFTVLNPGFQYWQPAVISQSFTVTRKERVRSTPYGFGLDPNSLSASQWTILGALGLTKAPRALR